MPKEYFHSDQIDDETKQKCLDYSLAMGYVNIDFSGEYEVTTKGKTFLLNSIKDVKW